MALNECHLPDEYVDALVSYDSSGSEVTSPIEDIIMSVISIPWLGNNDNATEKLGPTTNDIFLNDCHLPDDYVDVVLSAYGTDPSERSKDLSAKNAKSTCENESRRNGRHAWVGDEASKAKKDDGYALKKAPIIGNKCRKRFIRSTGVSGESLTRRPSNEEVDTHGVGISVTKYD
jgi:hypothetical protein